mmetsp:Transcript_13007/g.9409  ORF Transcript_13007/g.9409 Transcript_13007/m.9409 type:complete len:164 (+) Transcript_13007:18-509(+)
MNSTDFAENSTLFEEEENDPITYSLIHSVGSIALVMFCSSVGGILISLVSGIHFDGILCIPKIHTKPLVKGLILPPLIGMIIGGCVARNFFGIATEGYIELWASYIRKIALCLLLTRGGLTITFRGKGKFVILISFVPQMCEACFVAIITHFLLDFDWIVSFL